MDLSEAEDALATGDIRALRAAVAGLCSGGGYQIDELLRFAFVAGSPRPNLGAAAAPFLTSISRARDRLVLGGGRCFPPHGEIGRDLDFLGELHDHDGWTSAQWLNLLILGRIIPRRRAAVVGTMRDDGIYVLEWIAHYLALGFERVFIYTNDNADGSEHLLRRLAALDIISLIESDTSGMVRPGVKAFNHAVHLQHELRDYEWVLFVDSDEYFVPASQYDYSVRNILDALAARYPDGSAGAIAYQWLWYNSAMVFERKPGMLAERFQYATPHWLTKSLVRLRDILSMRLQHFPELKSGRRIVDSAFGELDPARAWQAWPTQYAGGRINHYWPKSFEEFSIKKARGETLMLADNEYVRDVQLFFEWNGEDTAETHHPVAAGLLAKVRDKINEIRALDGVARCVEEAERGFRRLVGRYEHAGGLRRIYEAARP